MDQDETRAKAALHEERDQRVLVRKALRLELTDADAEIETLDRRLRDLRKNRQAIQKRIETCDAELKRLEEELGWLSG